MGGGKFRFEMLLVVLLAVGISVSKIGAPGFSRGSGQYVEVQGIQF